MKESRDDFVKFIREGMVERIQEEETACYSDKGTEITDEFINKRLENYGNLLNSGIMRKIDKEDSGEER